MAEREELVDAIASFALFADLSNPQLEGIVHLFEEAVFSQGEKILRQGLAGSGFYVILDGEAAIVVDGTERARIGRGEFFGEVSIILGESPIADVVALRPMRCLRCWLHHLNHRDRWCRHRRRYHPSQPRDSSYRRCWCWHCSTSYTPRQLDSRYPIARVAWADLPFSSMSSFVRV